MEKIILLIFILKFLHVSNAIIIPFQTYNPLITKNETLLELIKNASDKSIVDTLSRNLIYTELNVGQNIQTVPTFLEMRTKDLVIFDSNIKGSNGNPPITNSNFTYGNNYLLKSIYKRKLYNSNYSTSYHFKEDCYDFLLDCIPIKNFCSDEVIYFANKKNINDSAKTKEINLLITFKKSEYHDHRPAIFGFSYYSKFILELKDRTEINGYDFSFKYTNTQEDKSTSVTKSYSDIKGTYESQTINMNEGSNLEPCNRTYTLILSEKGTFAYYHLDTGCHYVGYYTIVDNKLTLNSVVLTGNDPSASLSNDVLTLTINNDGTIVDSEKKMFGSEVNGNLKFTRKSETPREDINIANVIDHYLAGCGTSGKDGQGPWFTGLSK